MKKPVGRYPARGRAVFPHYFEGEFGDAFDPDQHEITCDEHELDAVLESMDEDASIGTELDTVLVDVPLPPSAVSTMPSIDEQLASLKSLLASQSAPTPVDPDEKTAPIDVPPLPVQKPGDRTDSAPGQGRTDRRG